MGAHVIVEIVSNPEYGEDDIEVLVDRTMYLTETDAENARTALGMMNTRVVTLTLA